jgi:hypothetical protein
MKLLTITLHIMLALITIPLLTAVALAADAPTPAAPIAPEVDQRFPGIPPAFPHFEIPDTFRVVEGGAQYETQWFRLETRLPPELAVELLAESVMREQFSDFRTLAGRDFIDFITTAVTRAQRSLCRDDVGYLTLEGSEKDGFTEVVVKVIGGPYFLSFESCQQEVDRQQNPPMSVHGAELRAMMQFAPVLDLPDTATVIQPPVSGNTSRSPDMYETSAVFASDMSGAQIFELLAEQIAFQGWSPANAEGDSPSLDATWLKDVPERFALRASVNVVEIGAGRIALRMRVEKSLLER